MSAIGYHFCHNATSFKSIEEIFPSNKKENQFFVINKKILEKVNINLDLEIEKIELNKIIKNKFEEVRLKLLEIRAEDQFLGQRNKTIENESKFENLTGIRNIPILFYIPVDSKKIMFKYLDTLTDSFSVHDIDELIEEKKYYLLPDPAKNIIFTFKKSDFMKVFDLKKYKTKIDIEEKERKEKILKSYFTDNEINLIRNSQLDGFDSQGGTNNVLNLKIESPKFKLTSIVEESENKFLNKRSEVIKRRNEKKKKESLICFENFGKYSFKYVEQDEAEENKSGSKEKDHTHISELEECLSASEEEPDNGTEPEGENMPKITLNGNAMAFKLKKLRSRSYNKEEIDNDNDSKNLRKSGDFRITRSSEKKSYGNFINPAIRKLKRDKTPLFKIKSKKNQIDSDIDKSILSQKDGSNSQNQGSSFFIKRKKKNEKRDSKLEKELSDTKNENRKKSQFQPLNLQKRSSEFYSSKRIIKRSGNEKNKKNDTLLGTISPQQSDFSEQKNFRNKSVNPIRNRKSSHFFANSKKRINRDKGGIQEFNSISKARVITDTQSNKFIRIRGKSNLIRYNTKV